MEKPQALMSPTRSKVNIKAVVIKETKSTNQVKRRLLWWFSAEKNCTESS